MSPEISKYVFKEAVEYWLLQQGPDAGAGIANAVREMPPGGSHKRRSEEYDRRSTACTTTSANCVILLPHTCRKMGMIFGRSRNYLGTGTRARRWHIPMS